MLLFTKGKIKITKKGLYLINSSLVGLIVENNWVDLECCQLKARVDYKR